MRENTQRDIYWGIGLENETYMQFEESQVVSGAFIHDNIGRDRYSLDYRKCYKSGYLAKVIETAFDKEKQYTISRMMNSHSLEKLDIHFQHKTLAHTTPAADNPDYAGKSILELFLETQPYNIQSMMTQKNNPMGSVNFDGDSIEFVTKYFENRTIPVALAELKATKRLFLEKLNESKVLKETLAFPEYNAGLNFFLSNPESIVLFNNGTYHFHFTLPTLTEDSRIVDYPAFEAKHINAIYLLQWFEPLIIASLGSPDILGVISKELNLEEKFALGSMRNAMSRYTGVGTYHKSMAKGKILTYKVDEFRKLVPFTKEENIWWRDRIDADLGYELLEDIGLDFNLEKMYQSGFEFRTFDEFPIDSLEQVLNAIVLICEHSLHLPNVPWGHESEVWNSIVYKSLRYGHTAELTMAEKDNILNVFALLQGDDDLTQQRRAKVLAFDRLDAFFFAILAIFHELYQDENFCVDALCGKKMEQAPKWDSFNAYQIEQHLKQFQGV